MSCPGCGKWVTDKNRKQTPSRCFDAIDSDQLVLFRFLKEGT
ncbi:MAG: hypothetical protein ACLRXQ_11175 [Phascolarctobacterium faecium]